MIEVGLVRKYLEGIKRSAEVTSKLVLKKLSKRYRGIKFSIDLVRKLLNIKEL